MTLCEDTPRREKPRVLIVDEYAPSNEVMVIALRSRGFDCLAVTCEALALASMEAFRPDVVILEWASRMQRDVDKAVRLRTLAQATGRTIAVVVVTYESELPPAEARASVGAYFTKPVELDSLEKAIEKLTRDHRAG